jgi:phytoene synthase
VKAGSQSDVARAYRHCWGIATAHYENFTVGSWLLPRRLRRHIAAIYAFARTADDFADEGERTSAERLRLLEDWQQRLDACYDEARAGTDSSPIFIALADTIQRFAIPRAPFRNLLDAFRYDAEFQPFPDFAALREYCRRSADPVGRLILYLFGYRDAERQALADLICTGLQLTNFWQDLGIDVARGRLYLPEADLQRFGCDASDIRKGRMTSALRELMVFEVRRTRDMLNDGLRLTALVDRRLAREVKLFAWGGLSVLDRIEAGNYDVLTQRPVLSRAAKTRLVWKAFVGSRETVAVSPRTVAATRPSSEGATLREAYAYCEEITRRSSSNFFYAFRLLTPERRDALFAVYAFCRFVDDIADEDTRNPTELLERWRQELALVYGGKPVHPISRALADVARSFPIERRHFLGLIRGVEMDLSTRRYGTFEELYQYCYLVASTVGLLCIEIFGYRSDTARQYAIDLGIAFQLTNILRDVLEDSQRGRIYLPLEDFRRFDCTEAELLSGHYSPRLGALLAFECGRARAYYLRATGALAPEDRVSLAAAEAMRLIYERLLDRIEARHFDVFGSRITLPVYEKVTLALAAWGRSQWALRLS